jgi:hypothetical protein
MNPNQHFFQAFFGPQQMPQQEQPVPEYIIHNESILEVFNNWDNIKTLLIKQKTGKLKKIDNIEQDWFNYLNKTKIDLNNYVDEYEFFKIMWKTPDV